MGASLPLRHPLAGLLIGAAVAATAAVDAGYFAPAWGWSSLGFLLAAAVTLIVADRVDVSRLDLLFVSALAAFVAWAGVSTLWSESAPRSMLELERGLVYVAGAGALALVARRGGSAWLAGGVLTASGAIAAYALATRLFPDRFGYDLEIGYQLARPLGYWNALGILAAVGIVVALAFVEWAGQFLRAAAAAALPVLVVTLYFTFSRGALVALAVGLVAMAAAHPRRLRLAGTVLALAPLTVLGVFLASRSDGLAREQAPLDVAAREGHRLAAAIVVLAAGSALVGVGFGALAARVALAERVRPRIALGFAGLALVGTGALLVAAGGPVAIATRAYDSFRAPLPASGGELEGRLFSVSGNGRADYWRVALDAYGEEPLLGTGAGTYELHWNRDRPTAFDARDAHSLYLETLTELGPLGLFMLAAALAAPLLALPAARSQPLASATAGGYVAVLAHAAIDWDWELPAVTLAGLGCGVAVLVAARRPEHERSLTPRVRAVALAAIAVVSAFVFVAYVGNSALAASSDEAEEGRYERAASHARRAARWTPWASAPRGELGEAELARGRLDEARDSFRAAIEQDPRDWSLWYGLARASDGAERAAAIERARQLNPRSPELSALTTG